VIHISQPFWCTWVLSIEHIVESGAIFYIPYRYMWINLCMWTFKKEMLLSMIRTTIIHNGFTLKCLMKEITLQEIWYGTSFTMNAKLLHAIYLGNTRWTMSLLAMRLLDKSKIHSTTSITLLNHRLIPFLCWYIIQESYWFVFKHIVCCYSFFVDI
jgi:hypothetical protein